MADGEQIVKKLVNVLMAADAIEQMANVFAITVGSAKRKFLVLMESTFAEIDCFSLIFFHLFVSRFSCEKTCQMGFYGFKCLKHCQCISNKCNHMTGVCISAAESNSTASPMNRTKRVRVEHWMPMLGNGMLNVRKCLNGTECNSGINITSSDQKADNSSIIIKSLNSSIANLTDNIGKLSQRVSEQQRQLELAAVVNPLQALKSTPTMAILVESPTASDNNKQNEKETVMIETPPTIELIEKVPAKIALDDDVSAAAVAAAAAAAAAAATSSKNGKILHVITGLDGTNGNVVAQTSNNATKIVGEILPFFVGVHFHFSFF